MIKWFWNMDDVLCSIAMMDVCGSKLVLNVVMPKILLQGSGGFIG